MGIEKQMDRKCIAVISKMNQHLGYAVGNSIEIEESIDILKGRGPSDATELTMILASY